MLSVPTDLSTSELVRSAAGSRPLLQDSADLRANRISAIIVEDEPLMRRGVELMMQADAEVCVVADCADGRSAVNKIRELRPDLVLLDIQMPELNGFDVLEALNPSERPQVIFVTGCERHALRAFEVRAVDYLLKPFSSARFSAALARAKDAIRKERAGRLAEQFVELMRSSGELAATAVPFRTTRSLPSTENADRQLVLKADRALHFIKTSDLIWVEAQGDFIKVQTGEKIQRVRDTLQNFEQKLDASKFLRIHRSFLVNLDHVSRVEPALYGDYSVYMSDGSKLRLSRNYRAKLRALINRVPVS